LRETQSASKLAALSFRSMIRWRRSIPMDFGTVLGKAAIAAGFVAFMGFAGAGFLLLRTAQAQYRRGQSDINPLACIAVATAALVLFAHLRALILALF
jgi:hypothetical protein